MSTFHHGNAGFRVCIDSTVSGHMSGRVYSQRLKEPIIFTDIGNLVLSMDEVLDEQRFPEAYQRSRSFGKKKRLCTIAADSPENGLSVAEVEGAKGGIMYFDILILTRRSSSWQGIITWPGGERSDFDSALEILRLIDAKIESL